MNATRRQRQIAAVRYAKGTTLCVAMQLNWRFQELFEQFAVDGKKLGEALVKGMRRGRH